MKKLYLSAIVFFLTAVFIYPGGKIYICYPCGADCDLTEHSEPGKCSICGMDLVEKLSVKYINLEPEEVCSHISENKDLLLLDVRNVDEYESKGDTPLNSYGHLKNALNIPVNEVESRLSEIEPYRDKEIIVYCARGHRSAIVSHMLTEKGFSKVYNMLGGMALWTKKKGEELICKDSLLEK